MLLCFGFLLNCCFVIACFLKYFVPYSRLWSRLLFSLWVDASPIGVEFDFPPCCRGDLHSLKFKSMGGDAYVCVCVWHPMGTKKVSVS